MELRDKKQNWEGGPEPGHSPTLQGARLLPSALVLKWELSEIFQPRKCLPLKTFPVQSHDLSGARDGIQVSLGKLGTLAVHPGPAQAPSVPETSYVLLSHTSLLASPLIFSVRVVRVVLTNEGADCMEDVNSCCRAAGQGLLYP